MVAKHESSFTVYYDNVGYQTITIMCLFLFRACLQKGAKVLVDEEDRETFDNVLEGKVIAPAG